MGSRMRGYFSKEDARKIKETIRREEQKEEEEEEWKNIRTMRVQWCDNNASSQLKRNGRSGMKIWRRVVIWWWWWAYRRGAVWWRGWYDGSSAGGKMMRGNIIQMEVRSSEDQLLSLFLLIPRQQFIKKRSQRGRRNSRRRKRQEACVKGTFDRTQPIWSSSNEEWFRKEKRWWSSLTREETLQKL